MVNAKTKSPGALFSTRSIVKMALLAAIAMVVMIFEFPLPFAPNFYKLDFSEVVVLIGAFAMGPIAGVIIEFLKVLLNLFYDGTTTMYIGELANFIVGCAFVVPAAILYGRHGTRKEALLGCLAGSAAMVIAAALMNYFVLLPLYAGLMGISIDVIVGMGSAINGAITNVGTFVLLATVPMNLVKAVASSLVAVLLYKYIAPILRR